MDRSLDDAISDRPKGSYRARRAGDRYNDYPRDGVRKVSSLKMHGAFLWKTKLINMQPISRDASKDLDKAWIHDRYEGDAYSRRQRDFRDPRDNMRDRRVIDRYNPEDDDRRAEVPAKLRVDNLHYDLNETDLRELFTRIAPIMSSQILYDRSDRSKGTAYVTYTTLRDARLAIREFDGANAYGQPIKLTLVPNAPSGISSGQVPSGPRGNTTTRNSFDHITGGGRSLFDRIDEGVARGPRNGRGSRRRSLSPERGSARRSDVTGPAPEGIDRYVPGPRRSRSPLQRRGRGPGVRREESARDGAGKRDREGRPMVQGRPRKTANELDAEMEDYWGAAAAAGGKEAVTANGNENGADGVAADGAMDGGADLSVSVLAADDGDIDMIE